MQLIRLKKSFTALKYFSYSSFNYFSSLRNNQNFGCILEIATCRYKYLKKEKIFFF
jgi:hypothetical protein